MFITTRRIIKFTWQNFWRNIWLSFVTITIVTLALLNVNALLVLNVLGERAVSAVQDKLDLSVSFTAQTSEDIVAQARGYLQSLSQVRTVTAFTPDEVLQKFKNDNANQPDVLASLDEIDGNPFGAQLVITAHSPDDFAFILEALKNPQYASSIEETDFNDYHEMIDKITSVSRQLRNTGIVLGVVFTLIALLIVFNTIRVAIYTHREEIAIMRLVGASDLFVRAPFLMEGLVYSLLAVLICMGIVFPTLHLVEPSLDSFLGSSSHLVNNFQQQFWFIFGTQFVVFSVLNMFATALALRRYLKI